MSRRMIVGAAILIIAAAVSIVSAMDYSSALGQNGELGFDKPAMMRLGAGPFPVPDIGANITNAVVPLGDRFEIGNFRDVPTLSRQTLENIVPVPERKPLG